MVPGERVGSPAWHRGTVIHLHVVRRHEQRVVSILREFSPDIEVYSIDESFLRVETVDHLYGGATAMGQAMRHRIRQWTSLPVCAGFGESKTLAKFANHLAKKNAVFDGVCDLTALTDAQRQQWMAKIEVGEVWGVGRRITARLQSMGIGRYSIWRLLISS